MRDRGHEILPSASLLPENDPTTLFTGSGMQPMVPYLLGESHPKGTRLTDSQKCFRAQDIDEVGDNRHTTFFEMLGNWSLGDYFKREQISWMFEFLVDVVGLDVHRLYFTCFRGDDELGIPRDVEAAELWQELLKSKGIDAEIVDMPEVKGMQGARIFYYDESKNWWSRAGKPQNMPIGEPGGPDTEMFWDFSEDLGLHEQSEWKDEVCHVNCDCGRFMEIGNNVFMEYRKTEDGFEKLVQQNVDFGGGLERLAAAKRNDFDVFNIDLWDGMKQAIETVSGKIYGDDEKETYAYRVILDHLRSAVFLIADGAFPDNKDQGYFTRRLMRRSIRFAYDLNVRTQFCEQVAAAVIDTYAEVYPEITKKRVNILEQITKEEKKFRKTLERGLILFEGLVAQKPRGDSISAKEAFDLYQSYGFPLEMTEELAEERGLTVDRGGFYGELEKHQNISRQGAEKKFKGGLADHSEMSVKYHTATHLLHIALRKVLGDHVEQKGSNITPERLRFDFSHLDKLTAEQKTEIERLVNEAIERNYPVTWQEMPVKEAYEQGVIGFFPDRYDDVVKVYTIGDPEHPGHADPTEPTFSREICGGPHVERTGGMGHFRIQKEEACSAGIRRIKAVLEN